MTDFIAETKDIDWSSQRSNCPFNMSLVEYDSTWTSGGVDSSEQSTPVKTPATSDDSGSNSTAQDTDGAVQPSSNGEATPSPSNDTSAPTPGGGGGADDEDDDEDVQTIMQIMDVTEMETQTGQSIVTRTRRFRKPKSRAKDRFSDYAAVLRRRLNDIGRPISSNLEIKSPNLLKAFKEIFKDFEGMNLEADPIIIAQPYAQLFWRKDEIKAYRNKASTKASIAAELDVILQFIENNPELERIQSEYKKHESQKMITSAITWTLFPPGTLAVINMPQMPAQCIKVTSCSYNGNKNVLQLRFLIFQFNGREFGNTRRSIAIELPMTAAPFPITDLLVFPIHYHKSGSLRKTLIERGHKYARLVQRAHMDYRGVAWIQDPIDQTTVQTHVSTMSPF